MHCIFSRVPPHLSEISQAHQSLVCGFDNNKCLQSFGNSRVGKLVSLGCALFFTEKHTNSNIPQARRTETNVEGRINYLIQEVNEYTMLRWYVCMYLCRYANANVPINTEFWID